MQIKGAIEEEDCLQDIVARAKEEDSTRLEAIVEGWLMTGFKKMVTRHLREVSDAL